MTGLIFAPAYQLAVVAENQIVPLTQDANNLTRDDGNGSAHMGLSKNRWTQKLMVNPSCSHQNCIDFVYIPPKVLLVIYLQYPITHMFHVWYIYLHNNWCIFGVGKDGIHWASGSYFYPTRSLLLMLSKTILTNALAFRPVPSSNPTSVIQGSGRVRVPQCATSLVGCLGVIGRYVGVV